MTAPVVVLFPGASLMDISEVHGGLAVRCPGCDATEMWRIKAGSVRDEVFRHEDACPVHARIEAAIQSYERETVRH